MKKNLTLCLFIGLTIIADAQPKLILSKAETILYIDKKMKEAEGYQTYTGAHRKNTTDFKLADLSFQKSPDKENNVLLCYTKIGQGEDLGRGWKTCATFNPAYIGLIEKSGYLTGSDKNEQGPGGNLSIKFPEGTVIETSYQIENGAWRFSRQINVTYAFLYFFSSDITNYDKIKKALEHLRDLYKAADDPFGK